MEEDSSSIALVGLTTIVRRFEEMGSLCIRPRSGAPRLSEDRTSDVA